MAMWIEGATKVSTNSTPMVVLWIHMVGPVLLVVVAWGGGVRITPPTLLWQGKGYFSF